MSSSLAFSAPDTLKFSGKYIKMSGSKIQKKKKWSFVYKPLKQQGDPVQAKPVRYRHNFKNIFHYF